ncbi:TPA_asm: hypothetical protein GZO25_09755 [Listeria monocytogenes]|nr:hypothetical protein [Listeria monocytogenes]HAC4802236.1 hypothetical protein [Listeria monocytogenes]
MTTAEIVRMILLDDMTRFYDSKEWKKVRAEAIERGKHVQVLEEDKSRRRAEEESETIMNDNS